MEVVDEVGTVGSEEFSDSTSVCEDMRAMTTRGSDSSSTGSSSDKWPHGAVFEDLSTDGEDHCALSGHGDIDTYFGDLFDFTDNGDTVTLKDLSPAVGGEYEPDSPGLGGAVGWDDFWDEFHYTVTMPGAIVSATGPGEVQGNTYSFTLSSDDGSDHTGGKYQEQISITSKKTTGVVAGVASAVKDSPALIAIPVVLLGAVVVAVVLVLRKRRPGSVAGKPTPVGYPVDPTQQGYSFDPSWQEDPRGYRVDRSQQGYPQGYPVGPAQQGYQQGYGVNPVQQGNQQGYPQGYPVASAQQGYQQGYQVAPSQQGNQQGYPQGYPVGPAQQGGPQGYPAWPGYAQGREPVPGQQDRPSAPGGAEDTVGDGQPRPPSQ